MLRIIATKGTSPLHHFIAKSCAFPKAPRRQRLQQCCSWVIKCLGDSNAQVSLNGDDKSFQRSSESLIYHLSAQWSCYKRVNLAVQVLTKTSPVYFTQFILAPEHLESELVHWKYLSHKQDIDLQGCKMLRNLSVPIFDIFSNGLR